VIFENDHSKFDTLLKILYDAVLVFIT